MFIMSRFSRFLGNKGTDCDEVREPASDHLAEELPPEKSEKVRDHLSGCPPCKHFVDGLASLVTMLTRLPKSRTPPLLKRSILERTIESRENKEGKL